MLKLFSTNKTVHILLNLMAINYNTRPKFKKYLKTDFGYLNFTIGIKKIDRSLAGRTYRKS